MIFIKKRLLELEEIYDNDEVHVQNDRRSKSRQLLLFIFSFHLLI